MENDRMTLWMAIGRLVARRDREVRRLIRARMLWLGLAGIVMLAAADAAFALPERIRLALEAMLALLLLFAAMRTWRKEGRAVSKQRMVARLAESGNIGLDNDLVSALDFDERLQGELPPELSRGLMEAEVRIAAAKSAEIPSLESLTPPSLRRERRAAWVLAALTAILIIAFFDATRALAPRLLLPLGDHPPFSLTQLRVQPGDVEVDYGGSVTVAVTATGPRPQRVDLVLWNARGEEAAAVPMFENINGDYTQKIEDVREDYTYFARIQRGRSKRHDLRLNKSPRIESAIAEYAYPQYTQLEPKTRSLEDEPELSAYRGTQISLTIHANRPLGGGTLNAAGQEIPLEPHGDQGAVRGVFTVAQSGPFSLEIVDSEGHRGKKPLQGMIKAEDDQKPEISIVSPGMDSFAIVSAEVPLAIEASDDLGVREISVFRALNGSDDSRKPVFQAARLQRFASQVEYLDLADLGLRVGDIIEYYATATDANPTAPQTAATPPYRLLIITDEEYAEYMRAQMTAEDLTARYEEMLKEIEALAQEQQKVDDEIQRLRQLAEENGTLWPEDQQRLDDLQRRQGELAQAAEELAQYLRRQADAPAIFDIENEYKKSLEQFAQQIEQAGGDMQDSRQMMHAAQNPGADPHAAEPSAAMGGAARASRDALRKLSRSTETFREGIQEANRQLEMFAGVIADAQRFLELYEIENALERQARTYRETASPTLDEQIRLKELGEQQAEVREALTELKSSLREHAQALAEEFPEVQSDAETIAAEIESRQIESLLDAASASLEQTDGLTGYPTVAEARAQMEEMISICNSMGQEASNCPFRLRLAMPEMSPRTTLAQLGANMSPGSGRFGARGQGISGQGGSQSPFAIFGPDSMNARRSRQSRFSGRRSRRTVAGADPSPLGLRAGNVEVMETGKDDPLEVHVGAGESFFDEYRPLIEAYFLEMARDEP